MSQLVTPLISTDQLHSILDQENLVILDASIPPVGKMAAPETRWPDVAISNARFFDIEHDFSDSSSDLPHTLPSAEQFQASCQKLGINNDSLIVVYDDLGMFSSARAWYLFNAMGHKHVAVLNGGLPKWLSSGYPVDSVANEMHAQGSFTAVYEPSKFCCADQVEQARENPKCNILDARAKERFLGLIPEPRVGVRAGHIPHSICFPYLDLLENGVLKPTAELARIFERAEVDFDNQWIMSCGSGITACILALAATIVGHNDNCVYDGSWSEWGQDLNRAISCNLSC